MHDIRAIRADPESFNAAMLRRGISDASGPVMTQDHLRRHAIGLLQEKQSRRTELSKLIGAGKRSGANTSDSEAEAIKVRLELEILERAASQADTETTRLLESLPNILDPDVPEGKDETANRLEFQRGEKRAFDFPAKQHFELGETLGLMDFPTAAKLAGARFTVLRGALARMERALGQFMTDLHVNEHGYTELSVPSLVNDAALYGTGQLPKFADDLFKTTDGRWLIPTAEVPLTNTVAGEILLQKQLPLRLTALTDCFRSEAGAAGRDTRGMLRQHQFRKVELVSITHPDESAAEHERMTQCAEAVLTKLGLTFRRVLLCAGDTGFSAAKTYDLEVWLPGQQAWREISSCSNCRDFQARRMNARFRAPDGKTIGFVHTLNGSGVAVGRALIAVMETYQQPDGSILVPPALAPYMGGTERISPA